VPVRVCAKLRGHTASKVQGIGAIIGAGIFATKSALDFDGSVCSIL